LTQKEKGSLLSLSLVRWLSHLTYDNADRRGRAPNHHGGSGCTGGNPYNDAPTQFACCYHAYLL
jgi:hypothetical protein